MGKYHKVYLPREEIEGGLTSGSAYPVFRTDFGKVGLMICWDVLSHKQFASTRFDAAICNTSVCSQ
jgi:predicted amidohydrolase